jgi:hypothetical protein
VILVLMCISESTKTHQWSGLFTIRGLCTKTTLAASRKDELGDVTMKLRGEDWDWEGPSWSQPRSIW